MSPSLRSKIANLQKKWNQQTQYDKLFPSTHGPRARHLSQNPSLHSSKRSPSSASRRHKPQRRTRFSTHQSAVSQFVPTLRLSTNVILTNLAGKRTSEHKPTRQAPQRISSARETIHVIGRVDCKGGKTSLDQVESLEQQNGQVIYRQQNYAAMPPHKYMCWNMFHWFIFC